MKEACALTMPSEGENPRQAKYAVEEAWISQMVMPVGAMLQVWTRTRSASLTLGSAVTRDELPYRLG